MGPSGLPSPEEHEINISQYLHTLRRHWKAVAAVTVLCAGAAVVHFLITPKLYRAATTIQIERRSLAAASTNQMPWLEELYNYKFYPTQYTLLRSRGLAERVVQELHLADDPRVNGGAASGASAGKSKPNAKPTTAGADDAALGAVAGRIEGGLTVTPIGQTQLVELSYISSSPEYAARLANGFAEAFINWGIDTRAQTASQASVFLKNQIDSLKREIQDKEARLQAYGKRTDIVALDPSSNVTLQRLESLNSDYLAAVSDRIDKEAAYQELLNSPKESVADTLSGGLVGQLRSQQIQLEQDYQTKLGTYKPDWPAMVALKSKIDKGQENLDKLIDETVAKARDKAKAAFQTAQRKEQSLADELKKAKAQTMTQNSAAVQYNNLKTEVSTRRALLDELLKKQAETEMASSLQSAGDSNVRVIDRALVPGAPFRPSLKHDLTYGIGLGLFLGIGLVFLIDFMDRTIKNPEEVERLLGLPVLAVIPDMEDAGKGYGYGYGYGYGQHRKHKRKTTKRVLEKVASKGKGASAIELLPQSHPRVPAAEAYRSFRTALMLSTADELRIVAITSASSGEGKTATSTNLAVVMAQLGRKTLLVDCDFRKPRIHKVFNVSNRSGMVTYLTAGSEPESIVYSTDVPNLFAIPSGPIPPNPSELLASGRMKEFLRLARQKFDFIVLDTPPVLAVTDAAIAGAQADGVVLCFHAGRALREDAKVCRDRLAMADIHTLGVVLNRFRIEKNRRYGSHYQYYYQSYGEGSDDSSAAPAAS